MGKTSIEWTDRTWEPVQGCTPVSAGCRNCYAERLAKGRLKRFYPEGFNTVLMRMDRLEQPLHWRKPSKVFVCSRSDLFHPDVPDSYVDRVFYVMTNTPHHTYQILTKRPERIPPKDNWAQWKHIWLGVSVEDQKNKPRIDILRDVPAKVRFLSLEPLLEDFGEINLTGIHWVIVGGESGPGARPMHPAWARSVRDQCQAAGVPFFFKQWGEYASGALNEDWIGIPNDGSLKINDPALNVAKMTKVGKKAAGRLLDGREHNELPGGNK